MYHQFQSGTREIPASNRRQGSRQPLRDLTDINSPKENNVPQSEPVAAPNDSHPIGVSTNAALPHAATDGENGSTRTHANAASRSVTIRRGFEPLIDSCEAARLLGNIHVKTLQRYARRGGLPGYQIGGHWYFRASELDSWLRSRLNSSCHPCRLSKEAK
jgi:excisionase family DNA binding protein